MEGFAVLLILSLYILAIIGICIISYVLFRKFYLSLLIFTIACAWPIFELNFGRWRMQMLCDQSAGTKIFGRATGVQGVYLGAQYPCISCVGHLFDDGYRFVEFKVPKAVSARRSANTDFVKPGFYSATLEPISARCDKHLSETYKYNVKKTGMCIVLERKIKILSKYGIRLEKKKEVYFLGEFNTRKYIYYKIPSNAVLAQSTSFSWAPTGPFGRELNPAGFPRLPGGYSCYGPPMGQDESVRTIFVPASRR